MKLIITDLIDTIGATSTETGYDIDDTVNKKPWTNWKAGAASATITADYSAAIDALYLGGLDAVSIRVYLKNGSAVTRYDSGPTLLSGATSLWIDEYAAEGWVGIKTDVVQAVIVLTHATAPSVATVFGGALLETTGENGLSVSYKSTAIKTDLYKPETAKNIIEGYQTNTISMTTVTGFDADGLPSLVSACRDATPWPMPCKPWPTYGDYTLFGWCTASGQPVSPEIAKCSFKVEEAK